MREGGGGNPESGGGDGGGGSGSALAEVLAVTRHADHHLRRAVPSALGNDCSISDQCNVIFLDLPYHPLS